MWFQDILRVKRGDHLHATLQTTMREPERPSLHSGRILRVGGHVAALPRATRLAALGVTNVTDPGHCLGGIVTTELFDDSNHPSVREPGKIICANTCRSCQQLSQRLALTQAELRGAKRELAESESNLGALQSVVSKAKDIIQNFDYCND